MRIATHLEKRFAFVVFITLVLATVASIEGRAQSSPAPQPSDPWKSSDLIQPQELAATLAKAGAKKPQILYVGFPILYQAAHIPGAVFLGAGRTPQGLAAIEKWARSSPRGEAVVMYCGCCPWHDCPNIRAAFRTLREAGVSNLKLLYIPTNLLTDWISKGYPVEKGS